MKNALDSSCCALTVLNNLKVVDMCAVDVFF